MGGINNMLNLLSKERGGRDRYFIMFATFLWLISGYYISFWPENRM
jgi:hypothetical protein